MSPILRSNKKQVSKNRAGLVALSVFAVLTIGLGFMQMRNTIFSPFAPKSAKLSGTGSKSLLEANAELALRDTDRDGLTDFEELNYYSTSPYLPDTDSDGVSDRDEISAGTDPNCPTGQNCSSVLDTPKERLDLSDYLDKQNIDFDIGKMIGGTIQNIDTEKTGTPIGGDVMGVTGVIDMKALLQDPTTLRKLLNDTGMITTEQLQSIDDVTLLKMAEDLLQKQIGQTNSDVGQVKQ